MIKSITIIPYHKDKSICSVLICDLQTGKNKSRFNCSLDSIADIVRCNLDDNNIYDFDSLGMKPEKPKVK